MKRLLFLLVLAALSEGLMAQVSPNTETRNLILDENLISVQLHIAGAPLVAPIVDLKAAENVLVLQFDHLGDEIKDYTYTLRHCNSDWTISELDDNEYIDGFVDDRIVLVDNSFNTLTPYTHYTLGLPNRNMRWSQSGNYVLQVFDNTGDPELVLTRRFMVVEPIWKTEAKMVQPAQVRKLYTHHEIDFNLTPKNSRVSNPQNDVKAIILQNGRWDNAVGPIKPYITRGEQIVFDYQDLVVFPAGKEFRFFDIRSFDYRGEFVRIITELKDYFEVTLQTDQNRSGNNGFTQADANGHFVIENRNANQGLLQCDYAKVLFSFSQNLPLDEEDVYVFGELSDWQLKPEFKMEYSEDARAYFCEAFLKQGYYNYQYMVVNKSTGAVDEEGFEGNWHETGNQYTILVYYRPFGARFERLVSTISLDSRQRD